ncbi:MAG: hydrogen peroxide-inducible genes activator [Pseudomonadota bacterium]
MKLLPSLKQLEYLAALAESQHFGQAAEHCCVTPSTLSAGIRDLETILGVSVAERTRRTVLLTPAGQAIAERAQRLLQDAEALMTFAATQHAPMTGRLSLGAIPTISPYLLPKIYPVLGQRYPQLQLYLREEQTEVLLNRLRKGEIDIALMALPYKTEHLVVRELFEDQFLFACSDQHPLADRPRVTDDDLRDQTLLLLEEGHCLRTHALDACRLSSSPMRVQFEATSLLTLTQMVASDIGVTLMPRMAAETVATFNQKVRLIPLQSPASRQIGLVWRHSSSQQVAFEQLAELFCECG